MKIVASRVENLPFRASKLGQPSHLTAPGPTKLSSETNGIATSTATMVGHHDASNTHSHGLWSGARTDKNRWKKDGKGREKKVVMVCFHLQSSPFSSSSFSSKVCFLLVLHLHLDKKNMKNTHHNTCLATAGF